MEEEPRTRRTRFTTVTDIEWGFSFHKNFYRPKVVVAPVAFNDEVFDTVKNLSYRKMKGLRIGVDSILEVYPANYRLSDLKVERVLLECDYDFPKRCPVCKSFLEEYRDNLICTNPECEGKEFNLLLNLIIKSFRAGGKNLETKRLRVLRPMFSELGILTIDQLFSDFDNSYFRVKEYVDEHHVTKKIHILPVLDRIKEPYTFSEFLAVCEVERWKVRFGKSKAFHDLLLSPHTLRTVDKIRVILDKEKFINTSNLSEDLTRVSRLAQYLEIDTSDLT